MQHLFENYRIAGLELEFRFQLSFEADASPSADGWMTSRGEATQKCSFCNCPSFPCPFVLAGADTCPA